MEKIQLLIIGLDIHDPRIIGIPTNPIATPTPNVTVVAASCNQVTLDVTPVWFEQVKTPPADKIRFPVYHNKNSIVDTRIYDCLATYRSMKKEGQSIDFVSEPFQPSVSNAELLVVVLNEFMYTLGSRITFTKKHFQYDDSDYRTACGIGNLSSIHSMINSEENLQTAKFKLHLKLNYDDVTSSAKTLHDFTINLINDLTSTINCKKEFFRVFSITRASSINVDIGLTTPDHKITYHLAEQLRSEFNHQTNAKQKKVLRYLFSELYTYKWEAAVNYLQLQTSDFDPRYNRDYPNAHEEKRGNRPYYFPQGWFRHALKVIDKYPEDQVWLGMNNSPNEWCVAYHGTQPMAVKPIMNTGLEHRFVKADVCREQAKQQMPSIPDAAGLYVATHCEGGASCYTRPGFTVEGPPGTFQTYHVAFQCRVKNGKFTEHKDPVNVGLALRVFDEKAIRPYGLLLKAT